MTAFSDYLAPETIASIRAKVKGYAAAAQLLIDNWLPGGVGQQIFEAFSQTLLNGSKGTSALVRGYASLDTSTDPGDADPYDATNIGLAPAAGFLSEKGSGDFGTDRLTAAPATGPFTVTNNSGGSVTFAANALTFTATFNLPGLTYPPTYRNSPDPTIYTGPNNTVTIPNTQSLSFTITAETPGSGSNATSGQVNLTTVLAATGITWSNGTILGTDREAATLYRPRCRQAAALTSPNGPADSYRYLATSARSDGTYGNSTTGTPLGVTRVYVSQASSTGIVTVYIAEAGGAPPGGDVTIVSNLIKLTPGVIAVPDAITITVSGATNTPIAVTYSAKIKAANVPGGAAPGVYNSPGAGTVGAVFTAIANALGAYLAGVDIGGVDQVAGAGVIYTVDLGVNIATTQINNVTLGIYDVVITLPVGASTAIALGHVGTLSGSPTGTLTVV